MALSFSKACLSSSAIIRSSSYSSSRLFFSRAQSNFAASPNPSDLPDDASSSTDPLLRKLEDAIHRIIVRRSAPDWLPFLPGSSYWVPPPARSTSGGIAQLVEKLANPLTDEENLSTTTVRGWPSSEYFIKDANPTAEVKVTLINMEGGSPAPSNQVTKSEDEEG